MAADDSELLVMVRRLSAMPTPDRSFVLGSLDEHETRRLERLLKPLGAHTMSPALRKLASDCADGAKVEGVTERAVKAIAKGAAAEEVSSPIGNRSAASAQPWARLAARLMGR